MRLLLIAADGACRERWERASTLMAVTRNLWAKQAVDADHFMPARYRRGGKAAPADDQRMKVSPREFVEMFAAMVGAKKVP